VENRNGMNIFVNKCNLAYFEFTNIVIGWGSGIDLVGLDISWTKERS